MMKIIGIAIIAISTLLFSFTIYEKYKTRPKSLQKFIDIIEGYTIKLKWHKNSFLETFKDFETNDEYFLLAKNLIKTDSLLNAFINNNPLYSAMCLSKEDEIILVNFLKNCGRQNYTSEVSLCEKTTSALIKQRENACLKFKNNGSLYLKLGGVVALWIFILLI